MPDSLADRPQAARVLVPPPLAYAVPLVAGLLLHRWRPIGPLPAAPSSVAGIVFLVLGLVGLPAVVAFRRAGTSPIPWKPTTALVMTGPFRFTRNPMYVGFTCLYAGISLLAHAVWPLVFLPLVLAVMHYGVILREERYLEGVFGEPYRDYCRQVRRWI